jgi:thiol-disulfide isomerase/thioredoxin
MRLDPKYFNLFIAICALLTLIVIVYGTINYSNKQAGEFRDNLEAVRIDTLSFDRFSSDEILNMAELEGDPVVIQFWSTWSGKSIAVNRFLDEYTLENPSLKVVAAIVRDDEQKINEYLSAQSHNFIVVEGTDFFQQILVPGVPSQILISRSGDLFDSQVGDDIDNLRNKLDSLLNDG